MLQKVSICASLLGAMLWGNVTLGQGNFDLLRVDSDTQSTGAMQIFATATNPVVFPFFVTQNINGGTPLFDETFVEAGGTAEASLPGADLDSEASLTITAEMPFPWNSTTTVPQASLAVAGGHSIQTSVLPGGVGAGWSLNASGGAPGLIATGDFEVLDVPGHPEIEDGTLTGFLDVIVAFNPDSGLSVAGGGFYAQAGSSFVQGTRNQTNDGWDITGEIFDASGDSETIDESMGETVNLLIPIAEPSEVGAIHRVRVWSNLSSGAVTAIGAGTPIAEQAVLTASLGAWFEVEPD